GSPRGQYRHVEPGLAGAGEGSRSGPGATPGLGRGLAGSLVDPGARLRTGRLGLRGAPHYGNAQRAAAPWLRPTLLGPESDGVVPPTENRIELRGCVVYKVEQGEISERHVYYDQLEFLTPVGLVREAGQVRFDGQRGRSR